MYITKQLKYIYLRVMLNIYHLYKLGANYTDQIDKRIMTSLYDMNDNSLVRKNLLKSPSELKKIKKRYIIQN